MTATTHSGSDLFEGGPPIGLQRRLGLVKPGQPRIGRRMLLVILVGWLPLLLLAAAQAIAGHQDLLGVFMADLAVHARLLIAAPLLVFAEAACAPRLGGIASHFRDAGMVREQDFPRFDAAVRSTRRLRDSTVAEIVVIVLAYTLSAIILEGAAREQHPAWFGAGSQSWAGWWHAFISLPLLLILLLGWVGRLMLWTRLLAQIARLDLHLVPAHPDRTAGLRFVGYSLRACSILGFAMGAIVAGTVANGVVHQQQSIADYRFAIAGVAVFSVILFCGPLLLFIPKLLREWQRGIFQYGALADRFGREFEHKWFSGRKIDAGTMEVQDFSAATDLYQVVGNVYEMRLMPMDLRSVALLVVSTLLPFLPVLLLAIPLDTILSTLAGLML